MHLGLWRAQRIGVILTTVAGSSPRNSRAVSREASNRLNNNIISSERFPNDDQDEFLLAPKGAVFIASKMGQSSIKSKFERQKRRENVGIVARSGKARYGEQVKNAKTEGKGKHGR